MISTILSALLPIVFVAFLGWLAGRMRLVQPDGSTALSTFVVRFALPLSLFLAGSRGAACRRQCQSRRIQHRRHQS
jgi:malonate transporter and related proteins